MRKIAAVNQYTNKSNHKHPWEPPPRQPQRRQQQQQQGAHTRPSRPGFSFDANQASCSPNVGEVGLDWRKEWMIKPAGDRGFFVCVSRAA